MLRRCLSLPQSDVLDCRWAEDFGGGVGGGDRKSRLTKNRRGKLQEGVVSETEKEYVMRNGAGRKRT